MTTSSRILIGLATIGVASLAQAADGRARNVILFLGDAGGVSTLTAAGIYAHDKPQGLFIHGMPHVALSDTSALDAWVTDSAAGMTAIVTGRKTNNGMLSQLPDGQVLKTILEYAEEKGLATGVVTNRPVWDATPAACYAHEPSRKNAAEIFAQVFKPRHGDGVDVLIGKDRKRMFETVNKSGWDARAAIEKGGYTFFESPADLKPEVARAMSIYDGEDFAPAPVIDAVLQILSRNPRGYFLMVEWDMHTSPIERGLKRVQVMDELIRHVAGTVSPDTLVLFAADHSFDLRVRAGKKGESFARQHAATKDAPPPVRPVIAMENAHTGEDIVVAAQGPGAEQVRGFMPNTRIFHIMMSAYGWQESAPPPGFVSLFNGKDLTGWRGGQTYDHRKLLELPAQERTELIAKWTTGLTELKDGKPHWRVEGGVLVNDGFGGHAVTERDYGDFELLLDYKIAPLADSGVYLRGAPQVQIWDPDAPDPKGHGNALGSGGLWNNAPGTPGRDPLVRADNPVDEWNQLRILMVGSRVSVWLNRRLVVDHVVLENYYDRRMPAAERRPVPRLGPIQLQTHGGETHWRNIFLREIGPAEAASLLSARGGSG